ncbi:hypothetical protein HPB48_016922 [Haemaphysalis longicornis]|uniref:Carboxylesterase type B domain-containing protein n=1 Tax=Haemaphysalis longicornis TaxID=44386 RepID=A0A9J6G2N2_HAELO|nr:hypothetical protein HPB48_016922 [Haemaphysalis longicornis]
MTTPLALPTPPALPTTLLPPPKPLDTSRDAWLGWKTWKSEFQLFSTATQLNKQPKEVQAATLLVTIGEEARKAYASFRWWHAVVATVLALITSYFSFVIFVDVHTEPEVTLDIGIIYGRTFKDLEVHALAYPSISALASSFSYRLTGEKILLMDKQKVERKAVNAYYGIPYAKPPVGRNRFRRPEALEAKGRYLDARNPRYPCVQPNLYYGNATIVDAYNSSEDCLHLDIYTPRASTYEKLGIASGLSAVLVVLIDVHFANGGNSHFYADPRRFVQKTSIVVVVPNYRIGAPGFMRSGYQRSPGNMGLLDQVTFPESDPCTIEVRESGPVPDVAVSIALTRHASFMPT